MIGKSLMEVLWSANWPKKIWRSCRPAHRQQSNHPIKLAPEMGHNSQCSNGVAQELADPSPTDPMNHCLEQPFGNQVMCCPKDCSPKTIYLFSTFIMPNASKTNSLLVTRDTKKSSAITRWSQEQQNWILILKQNFLSQHVKCLISKA